MTRLDTDQADRDAVADLRHERDLHREPRQHRHPRCVAPVSRQAFTAAVQDSVNRSKAIRLVCPHIDCSGAVYAPADSDRERVVCTTCERTLITRRAFDGSVGLQEHHDDEAK